MTYRSNLPRRGTVYGCHSCGAEKFVTYPCSYIEFCHNKGCPAPRVVWLEDVVIPRGEQDIMDAEDRVRHENSV